MRRNLSAKGLVPKLKVGFPLYESFDSLDVTGPFQTFTFADMDLYLVGPRQSPVTSFEGIALTPRCTFDNCPQFDLLFVPGAADPLSVLRQGQLGSNPFLEFLARQAPACKLVCSVCTGALLLAAAGLLDGHTVTTALGVQACAAAVSVPRCRELPPLRFRAVIASPVAAYPPVLTRRSRSRVWCMERTERAVVSLECNTTRSPFPIAEIPLIRTLRTNPGMVEGYIEAFRVAQAVDGAKAWLQAQLSGKS